MLEKWLADSKRDRTYTDDVERSRRAKESVVTPDNIKKTRHLENINGTYRIHFGIFFIDYLENGHQSINSNAYLAHCIPQIWFLATLTYSQTSKKISI